MSMVNGMLSFLSARRKPGWMAILPQGGWVMLAHVVRERNARPEIRLLDTFAVENGEIEALQRLRTTRQLSSYACTTLIGASECNVTQLDAPSVPKEERKEALRWALKEMVGYAVDSACVDVLDIPADGLPPGRSAGVLVVSASEQAVRASVSVFEKAKVRLDVLDIPELAQRNVAALFEDENRGLAFLRIDESGMMLTLTFHGELIAVRRGDVTTSQLNGSDEEQRTRVRERLVLELQRSLDNFDRQYSHIPISKVVLVSYPQVENLAAELRENTYVPVQDMDLSSVIDFPALPELKNIQCQAKNFLAIGAALRTDALAEGRA
jgi:MSHA biogenesis protein MshI